MDLSKFKTSDWLKVGGGALMLIAGFLSWITFDIPAEAAAFAPDEPNAFDFFWTGTLPWILLVGVGVIAFLLAARMMKSSGTPWPLILLAAAALATLLVLIRVLFNPHEGGDALDEVINRGIGMWLALIASILVLAGAWLGFQESGGNINDLTDMNKLKRSFDQGGSRGGGTPPPPPPPGGYNPPPPPPGR